MGIKNYETYDCKSFELIIKGGSVIIRNRNGSLSVLNTNYTRKLTQIIKEAKLGRINSFSDLFSYFYVNGELQVFMRNYNKEWLDK